MAEFFNYDKVVQVAALLHDIGKPASRKVNPKNNHVQFFGHEALSEEMAEEILFLMLHDTMINEEELVEIKELISLHSLLHKEKNPHALFKLFKNKKSFYIHLVELHRCDTLGRFCADYCYDDTKHEKLLSFSKNMNDTAYTNT